MSIRIDDILKPFGKGSAAIALRLIEQDLYARFHVHIQQTISTKCFKEGKNYFIHTKVPSEGNPDNQIKIFYDVIFKFFPSSKEDESSPSIRNYYVEVFSNIPAFMFTFTHTFNDRKILIKEIPDKYYSKKALKEKADTRNQMNLIGIEKSIWFSVTNMDKKRLFVKTTFDVLCDKKLTLKELLKHILTQEEKYAEVERRNKLHPRENTRKSVEHESKHEEIDIQEPLKKDMSSSISKTDNMKSTSLTSKTSSGKRSPFTSSSLKSSLSTKKK